MCLMRNFASEEEAYGSIVGVIVWLIWFDVLDVTMQNFLFRLRESSEFYSSVVCFKTFGFFGKYGSQ
jgi:hypothetical protein